MTWARSPSRTWKKVKRRKSQAEGIRKGRPAGLSRGIVRRGTGRSNRLPALHSRRNKKARSKLNSSKVDKRAKATGRRAADNHRVISHSNLRIQIRTSSKNQT